MEKKLAEYRAKKEREKLVNETKEKIKSVFSRSKKNDDVPVKNAYSEIEEKEELLSSEERIEETSEPDSVDDSINCCTFVDMIYYALWFILWLTVYVIFIKLQFGTVYIVLSALIGMYINTRTSPKKTNEVSAYSVFNKNCESIDGTLKGEQFEREMGYRM